MSFPKPQLGIMGQLSADIFEYPNVILFTLCELGDNISLAETGAIGLSGFIMSYVQFLII